MPDGPDGQQSPRPPTRMIMVGGFLGAGKTTLLAAAAGRLVGRGRRVGLITNDQAADLVDTRLLGRLDLPVREVSAGCFCCNFNRLIASADELLDQFRPDVLLAEPVGSCVDLSATVLRPLRQFCRDRFALGPLTVLTDPGRLSGQFDPNDADEQFGERVGYIFDKQLEEADALAISKVDALTPEQRRGARALLEQRFGDRPILELSAGSGEGLDEWLDYVLTDPSAGRRVVEVDYDIYADGEAELGWLNALVKLRANSPVDWSDYARRLLLAVRDQCRRQAAAIAHVKLFLSAPPGEASLSANLVGGAAEPSVQGQLPPDSASLTLVVNARVRQDPADLKRTIEHSLDQAAAGQVDTRVQNLRHFRPGRPVPTHRLNPDSSVE